MLKVELHSHTSDDPEDPIGHTAGQLIDRAAALGYGALAITLHDRHTDDPALSAYARARGITLIPGIERTVGGRDVLLLNFPRESECVSGFDDVRALRRAHPDGLVVAPHPYYPLAKSLGGRLLDEHADLWDAIEISAFYVRGLDFNRRARRWAAACGRPLVGNGDVHQLDQLGTTYTAVAAPPGATPDQVCQAIRAGQVEVCTRPLSPVAAARIAGRAVLAGFTGRPRG